MAAQAGGPDGPSINPAAARSVLGLRMPAEQAWLLPVRAAVCHTTQPKSTCRGPLHASKAEAATAWQQGLRPSPARPWGAGDLTGGGGRPWPRSAEAGLPGSTGRQAGQGSGPAAGSCSCKRVSLGARSPIVLSGFRYVWFAIPWAACSLQGAPHLMRWKSACCCLVCNPTASQHHQDFSLEGIQTFRAEGSNWLHGSCA